MPTSFFFWIFCHNFLHLLGRVPYVVFTWRTVSGRVVGPGTKREGRYSQHHKHYTQALQLGWQAKQG